MHTRFVFLLVALLGVLGWSVRAEGRAVEVTSNTVVVDVVAADKGNRNVMDLRKEELQIFENDVPQEIDSFAPVHQPTTPTRLLCLRNSARFRREGNPHASKEAALGNLMVLLLDYATVEYINQDRVRKAAVR